MLSLQLQLGQLKYEKKSIEIELGEWRQWYVEQSLHNNFSLEQQVITVLDELDGVHQPRVPHMSEGDEFEKVCHRGDELAGEPLDEYLWECALGAQTCSGEAGTVPI